MPKDSDDVIYRKIIANTYNWLDSHGDVHLNGIFKKSIQENTPFFLADHEFKTTARLGEIMESEEKEVAWRELGIDKAGFTTSLMHTVKIEKARNAMIFEDYKNGVINQHSVGMQYVKVDLAVDDADDENGYKMYKNVLQMLGNPEKAEELGYFFVVSEAKLRETSAVLAGSNVLTGVYEENGMGEEEIKSMLQKFGNKKDLYNICKSIIETYDVEPLQDTQKSKPSFYELFL
jgi:hypothetical protein